jgi:hypothetical protein
MNKTLSPTFKITYCAMLLVLDIIATHVIRTPAIANFSFIRVSLGPAIVIYTSLFLGPFYGLVVGACGDLLGILIFQGLEGQINPLLTIVYGLLGVLPYFLAVLFKKSQKALEKPYIFYATLLLLLVLLVLLFYVIPYTHDYFVSGFGETSSWAFPLIIGLTGVFDVLAFFGLQASDKHFKKAREKGSHVPSPYEIALISLICEIVLMVLLKPLAFYVFYNWMASSPFPISYSVLISCMLVLSSLNVLINTFVVSWLLLWSEKFIINFNFGATTKD